MLLFLVVIVIYCFCFCDVGNTEPVAASPLAEQESTSAAELVEEQSLTEIKEEHPDEEAGFSNHRHRRCRHNHHVHLMISRQTGVLASEGCREAWQPSREVNMSFRLDEDTRPRVRVG